MLFSADRMLVPGSEALVSGHLRVDGDRITVVGTGPAAEAVDEHLDGIVIPGYVDVHVHGGGGASFITEDPGEARQVLAAHRRHGVTTTIASLVAAAVPDLKRQVACLAGLVEAGELAGIHLEGPWLSEAYHGAHSAELLIDPDPAVVVELLEAGRGTIRMVTIAPERAGGLATIRLLAQRGVVASLGHTNADFDTAAAAVGAGATGATHLFNAMAPLRHREPGPVLALMRDPSVYLELILDGLHVHPELVYFVMDTERGRAVLVTDAMAAAAAGDGDYQLGEAPVQVRGGVAKVAGTDTIAGSTLTLDRAVRNAVAAGVPLVAAVRAATATPADYLQLAGVGRIEAGGYADVVVLSDELFVQRVLYRGVWQ